jgi:hypothetical protein
MVTPGTPRTSATSCATRASTSSGLAPRATRVATRRSAPCSSASRRRSARAAPFEIALATRDVKRCSRSSVSGGSATASLVPTQITPHVRPSTTIGTPTVELTAWSRATRAVVPGSAE